MHNLRFRHKPLSDFRGRRIGDDATTGLILSKLGNAYRETCDAGVHADATKSGVHFTYHFQAEKFPKSIIFMREIIDMCVSTMGQDKTTPENKLLDSMTKPLLDLVMDS